MAKKVDNENVYPAGDQPPEEDEGHAGDQNAGKTDQGDQGDQGNQDWESRYKNLEKKLGEQGNEMGQLKKQNQELIDQLEQMRSGDQGKAATEQQAPGYEDKMNDIYKQLDDGDISVEDALRQSNLLTAEMTRANADEVASQKVQEALEQKDQEAMLNKFFEEHPDFEQLKESGALDQVKQQMPGFHDDFSAYFAYKAQTSANEAYEKGKQEMQDLAQGDANTDKVLQGSGSAIRNQNPEPLTDEGDLKQSMMQRLQQSRKKG